SANAHQGLLVSHHCPTFLAGCMFGVASEPFHDGGKLRYDIRHLRILFIKIIATVIAMPDESFYLTLSAIAFKYQTYGVGRTSRAMRHPRGQQEHIACLNVYIFGSAFVNYFKHNIPFELVKNLLPLIVVIIFS